MANISIKEENISDLNDGMVLDPVSKRRRMTSNSDDNSSCPEESDYDFFTDGPEDEDSEEDDVETKIQPTSADEWKCEGSTRMPFPFLTKPGIMFEKPEQEECIFYMEKFMDDDFIELIVEETNRYARQFFENNSSSRIQPECFEWVDTNDREMRVFIFLLILQGIVGKPSYDLYFTKRKSLETPFFYKTMSEKRFKLLVKFLHFTDNNGFDPTMCNKKTYKIDPILDYLKNKFKMLYIPQREITINESFLFWKGGSSWNQYIPSKGSQCSMKCCMLRESASGYIWNFILYTGDNIHYESNYSKEMATSEVVFELCHDLLDKGYILYLHNWYTSMDLVEELCKKNTDVVGVLRKNRKGIPYNIISHYLNKGECVARFKNKVMIMKWKSKRDVIILSTIHDNRFVDIAKNGKIIRKPKVVIDYNKCMGEVDLADEQIKIYQIAKNEVQKYYYKIFLYLLNMVCLNAYLLYKKDGGSLDKVNFIIEAIEKGIEKYGNSTQSSTTAAGQLSLTLKPSRLTERHFADYIPSNSSRANVTRRCKLCYSKGLRKESRYWCPDCNIALCMPLCFREYHTTT